MRFEVRADRIRSWADPESSRALAAELGHKLRAVTQGKRAQFVTLTYDRSPYSGPLDLYRCQSEQRHIRRFIERLGKFLGVSLRGKWLRKMEFQEGGWVHWHLVILTPKFIPRDKLAELWGHGFVNVQRMTPERCSYVGKYITKADDNAFPGFLMMERARSVKIVAVSPGFWGKGSRGGGGESRPPSPFYVPLGVKLAMKRERACLRVPTPGGKHRHAYRTVRASLSRVLFDVALRGGRVRAGEHGWLVVEGLRGLSADIESPGGGGAAAPPGLYLTQRSNPPIGHIPDWQIDVLESVGALVWEPA